MFDANPKLQSLLGVEPGCTSADFSQKNMQPHDCIILAHEMKAGRAIALLKSLVLAGNKLIQGRRVQSQEEYDQYGGYIPEYAGYDTLCTSLKNTQVTELNLSECDLDATATTTLADAIKAMAVVKSLVISDNDIFGQQQKAGCVAGYMERGVDVDQSGWSALCDTLPTSSLEQLIAADIGMGEKGVTSLAKAMSAGAALEVVSVSGACPTHQLIFTSLHQYVSIRNPCMLAPRMSEY